MTEEDIKIIRKEEYLNDEGTEQKIIFDSNIFDEIKGKELNQDKKVYNHTAQKYIENIYRVQTFLNHNPRATNIKEPNTNYITGAIMEQIRQNQRRQDTVQSLNYCTKSLIELLYID